MNDTTSAKKADDRRRGLVRYRILGTTTLTAAVLAAGLGLAGSASAAEAAPSAYPAAAMSIASTATAACDPDATSGPPSASIPPDLQPNFACQTPYVGGGRKIEHPWKCAASVAAGVVGLEGSWSARQVVRKGLHFATRWAPGIGEAAALYGAYSAYSDCQ